jgi:hypothetical protein
MLAGAATTWGAMAAQQFSNAATRLNLDRCLVVHLDGDATFEEAWRCKGFKNVAQYDVYVYEGDARFFVSYGPGARDKRSASQTLLPANSIGDSIEWRMERRAGDWLPFATILRYYTEVEVDGESYRGEVLVISRVGEGEACHVAYIDAKANANAETLAREAADTLARRFDCAIGEPVIYGEHGRSLGPLS